MEFFTDPSGRDLFSKKTEYRCGFEVYAAEWNPRHDLLAVASRNGDVVVKRHPWKSAWKKNISIEPGILYDNPNLETGERKAAGGRGSKLESLCWSPDGDILAIALADGLVHLVDGQDGKLLYSWRKSGPPAHKMRWLRACDAASCYVPPEDSTLQISSADFDFNENASKDRMQMMADIEHFCSQTLQTSLLGTVLCILSKTDDGPSMSIAVGGVLPLGDISNLGDFITSADPYSIEVHDVTIGSVTGKLQAVCSCCELMADAQGGATVGYSSYVVELDLGFADLYRMQQLSRLVV
ncbi:CBN-EMB-30 protein, partial [Aphelenchoides avenae]